ncbi:MAG: energy-coupling factor transporter ATPase [Clostridiales bacterium]|nr:energy-coupling factor transporter ATPase [Clostridiales bacterium]
MTVAELKNACYTYSKDTPFEKAAVNDVNVKFEQGKITGIIGHTGSGKSTLSQLLNGLLKVSSGEVYVNDRNIWAEPKKIKEIRFKVGLVFQYPEYQLFDETIRKDISFGPKNMGLDQKEIDERVIESIRFVGLPEDILDMSPFDISGGQKRRAAIAGIMAMRPEILVLDEPAAGLDPSGKKEIFDRLRKYKDDTDSTLIIISHSMEDMAEFCDNIVVMSDSRVFLSGTVDEVFSHSKELMSVGLTVPQATQILMELKAMGYDVNTAAYTVDSAVSEIMKLFEGGDKGA